MEPLLQHCHHWAQTDLFCCRATVCSLQKVQSAECSAERPQEARSARFLAKAAAKLQPSRLRSNQMFVVWGPKQSAKRSERQKRTPADSLKQSQAPVCQSGGHFCQLAWYASFTFTINL